MNDIQPSSPTDRGQRPSRLKAALIAGGLTAGLLGGGIAGLTLGSSAVSGAQDPTSTTVPAPSQEDGRPDPGQRLRDVLAPLVANGTITQAQADAVTQALLDARPERGRGDGPGGHGPGGHGPARKGVAAASAALGMSGQELAAELRSGQTLAQVAQARGVDPQVVIDAMVAELRTHLDEEVASGELTRAEADERLAKGTERITDVVNNGRPERGEGRGPGGRRGDGGAPPADAPTQGD